MKKLPVICLTSIRMLQEGPFLTGMAKTILNSDYTDIVSRVKGLPVIVPPVCSEEEIEQFASLCDGLVVTGGKDVAPILYGEMSSEKCGPFDVETDRSHIKLIQAVMRQNKPILGICRGMQLINVTLGGTLYQDISDEVPESGGHTFGGFRYDPVHNIKVNKTSELYEIMKTDMLEVNSIHHQAIQKLGEGVEVCGTAPDGIVEAVTVKDRKVLALQWHPEMMVQNSNTMLPIFEDFIKKCTDI